MRRLSRFCIVFAGFGAIASQAVAGQPISGGSELTDEGAVRAADQAFWAAFNHCDQSAMATRFTPDVEFYHDKTGLTSTRDAVTASMFQGPCAHQKELRLRREAVASTDHFFPLAGGFALLEGEHRFFATRSGQPERHDSVAKYLEVWQRTGDGTWRMRRVVSFDHRPDEPVLVGTPITAQEAAAYLGTYAAADGSSMIVTNDGGLTLRSGNTIFPLVRLAAGRFGTPRRWLEFRFAGDTVTVLEEGHTVAHGQRSKASLPR